MKRWLHRIILCLILGPITTVAVAWGCAVYDSAGFGVSTHAVYRTRTPQEEAQNAGYCLEFVPASSIDVRSGLPIPCLWSTFHESVPDTNDPKWRWVGSGGLVLDTAGGWIFVPSTPIWPGFLIDTLFYAAIWFGVFFGFTSAKRAIRRRRGRCPRCGYDLRGNLSAGCSECGWKREDAAP